MPARQVVGQAALGRSGVVRQKARELRTQARESGAALVLVTHSVAAAALADRVLHLRSDGIGGA